MISKFSVKKPYTVIVAVVLVIILGIVSFTKMTTDLLPSMELPYAIVMTTYQGASPETVETTVTKPVEQSMATISNIKEVNSISSENMSMVILEFEGDTDMNAVSLDMREKLDMIKGYWPDEVGNPTIMKLNPDMMPVMVTAMDSDKLSNTELSELINDKIAPSLEAVDGVASVSSTGLVTEQINAIISEKKINKLNEKIEKALNGQFDEAQNKIDQARAQMESGKNTLDAQRTKANTQLAKAQTALTDGQLSLAQKEVQVTSSITNLKVQKQSLQTSLKTLKTQIAKMEEQAKQVPDAATKMQLAAQIEELKKQETTAKSSIKALDKNLKALNNALKQIKKGKKTINSKLTQFNVQSATATQKMNDGEIKLAQGEAQLNSSQQQLDSSKEQAKEAANIKNKLTVANVKALLTAQNFEMPAGYISEGNTQYLVRVGDKVTNQKDLANMELLDLGIKGIPPVKLCDVADVAIVDNSAYCRVNGNNGVVLTVQKQNNYSTADVADKVAAKMKTLTKENKGFHYVNIMDQGVYIDMVTGSVIQNLLMGAILAVFILLLFLKDVRPTIVIACSIPLSVIFAVVLMYFTGITLNVISLSGLALGVGMLVDNSIVVIENIYRLRKEGVPVKEAAITGARGVAGAITSSTLTTISVFLPIVFTTGLTKQLFVDMGLTIGYSLVASLIVAVTFVPMMSAGVLNKVTQKDSKVINKLQTLYRKVMTRLLNRKIIVVAVTLALFAGSIFGAMNIGSSLMPSMDSTQMTMTIKMPQGSSMEETASMTDTVMKKVKEIKDVDSVAGMISSGSSGISSMTSGGSSNEDQSSMYVLLKEKKKHTNKEIKKEILKKTKKFDCEVEVQESSMDMSALGGSGISVQIKGNDLNKLRSIGKDIAQIVEDTKGTQNISNGSEETTPDLHVVVDKKKAVKNGLTVATIYQQLSEKLKDASEATTITINEKEYSVNVGNSAKNTLTRDDLKKVKLTGTVSGKEKEVTLDQVANFRNSDSLSSINRNQQERTLSVTSEIKDGYNVGKVSSAVQKKIKKYNAPKGYSITMKGEMESIQETTGQIGLMLLLAVAFMYLIMVAQFQSLKSPFIILFTIPMAFTGGFLGLLITGKDLSAIAMIGFVMLAGIIVNNGIVLVDTINQLRESGYEFEEAILTAGTMRVRPILMTALTTILGLSTMAIGLGQGAEMMQPMAIVTIGGLIYGTLLTLLVVPCIYGLFNRRKKKAE